MDQNENKDIYHITPALKQALEHLEDLYDNQGKLNYRVLTGFNALDKFTRGFHNGDLIAVTGQPGVGKSAFVLSLSCGTATRHKEKISVLICSTQYKARQLALRSLVAGARGTYSDMLQGFIREADWSHICSTAGRLSDLNLAINDTVSTIEDIVICARSRKQEHENTCLIIIDSLDSVTGEDPVAYSAALIRLKQLARELNLPMIITSATQTKTKLRMYATDPYFALLEKYTDVLLSLRKCDVSSDIRFMDKNKVLDTAEEKYDMVTVEKWDMEVSILKNKNGPNGIFNLGFLPQLSRFTGA